MTTYKHPDKFDPKNPKIGDWTPAPSGPLWAKWVNHCETQAKKAKEKT